MSSPRDPGFIGEIWRRGHPGPYCIWFCCKSCGNLFSVRHGLVLEPCCSAPASHAWEALQNFRVGAPPADVLP